MTTIETTQDERSEPKMDTSKLKRFAQSARRQLLEIVATKIEEVLKPESAARRETPRAVAELESEIEEYSKTAVAERVAYIWFNRFCALRYMDVNRVTHTGIVSPAEGSVQPEVLSDAKAGQISEKVFTKQLKQEVHALLDGTSPSKRPQDEAFRKLLVAACNYWHRSMPFMFERIADYSELLMPDDLLSEASILTKTREALTEDSCKSVEVIGWLYQFYISEKKDDVFAALKKGKKITPENIPAATQLFTPHWIVRYLVENSLGRLWMLNHPNSRLIEQMDYYIEPVSGEQEAVKGEEQKEEFIKIDSPEEIKICDPACGSGHMLTYAFDLLYAIYEEQGYQATDIPEKILTHNLYGIEIDQRAGALAAFALTMKAREKYRRFLTGGKVVQPNICVLENISIDPEDLSAYMEQVGRDLFSGGLQGVVKQWEEADNFGSLIRPLVTDVSEVLELLRERQMGEDLFLAGVHQKVLKALRQADYLSPKYHVVVANPPYMGSKGMNPRLSKWTKKTFPESKTDTFSAFIEQCLHLAVGNGSVAMVTMQSWMFLSSFEPLRNLLLANASFTTLIQIGYNSFPELNSKVAQACAFTIAKGPEPNKGTFFNLNDAPHTTDKDSLFCAKLEAGESFLVSKSELAQIPGKPIAYWVSQRVREIFQSCSRLGDVAKPRQGLASGDNERFMRYWYEVSVSKIGFDYPSIDDARSSNKKWFPHNKGGEFRKWFGNIDLVLAFDDENFEALSQMGNHLPSRHLYFKEGISWTALTTGSFNGRYTNCAIFDAKGPVLFANNVDDLKYLMALCNSKVATLFLKILAPTLDFNQGPVGNVPTILPNDKSLRARIDGMVDDCVSTAKRDWDSREQSFGFQGNEIASKKDCNTLEEAWNGYCEDWRRLYSSTLQNEEAINSDLIELYRIEDQLTATVDPSLITIQKQEAKHEGNQLCFNSAEVFAGFISYAVGCMLGRYSLDQPGLILANQGETADDYSRQIPDPTFAPDEDNVIPLLDGDWFEDDITERFKAFLKVTFGTEHYEENLTFLENALYPDNLTGKKRKTIRDYFLKEFYNHHIKLYKKRPIYWLFSSPKKSFQALIYMHRYTPHTVSVVLKYLRDFRSKLSTERDRRLRIEASPSASRTEKTKALKESERLKKVLTELETWESEVLHPLAQEQIEIDLDDGVKVNYNKFGSALQKVVGLTT